MSNEDYYIEFRYSFSSSLGCGDVQRCVKEHVVNIFAGNVTTEKLVSIGEMQFSMANIIEALDSKLDFRYVFDQHSEDFSDSFYEIVDTEREALNEKIIKHFGGYIPLMNICFIEKVYLTPEFRGFYIGAKAIKDVITHYSSGCCLFVIDPWPMQFGNGLPKISDPKELGGRGAKMIESINRLTKYFQTIGFDSIKGIPDFLFLTPSKRNDRLEMIDLDEGIFAVEWWKDLMGE